MALVRFYLHRNPGAYCSESLQSDLLEIDYLGRKTTQRRNLAETGQNSIGRTAGSGRRLRAYSFDSGQRMSGKPRIAVLGPKRCESLLLALFVQT